MLHNLPQVALSVRGRVAVFTGSHTTTYGVGTEGTSICQMGKPRLRTVPCPGSHGQDASGWDVDPAVISRAKQEAAAPVMSPHTCGTLLGPIVQMRTLG